MATMAAPEPVVPAGKLLIIGDNPGQSMDSRYLGYIPGERLLGIVVTTLPRNATGDAARGTSPAGSQRLGG